MSEENLIWIALGLLCVAWSVIPRILPRKETHVRPERTPARGYERPAVTARGPAARPHSERGQVLDTRPGRAGFETDHQGRFIARKHRVEPLIGALAREELADLEPTVIKPRPYVAPRQERLPLTKKVEPELSRRQIDETRRTVQKILDVTEDASKRVRVIRPPSDESRPQ